jgi:hypothetical protein
MKRFKNYASCIIVSVVLFGCVGEESIRKTNPGYVAFDYTCGAVKNYDLIIKNAYRLNEYIKQTTIEKRDSVDRLYFSDVKISHNEGADLWTLRLISSSAYHTEFTIDTDGKSIDEENAVWTVSTPDNALDCRIENKGNQSWHIAEGKDVDALFDYSTQWDVRFNGQGYSLEGSGTLLSLATPKLKLEYTIKEPLEIVVDKAMSAGRFYIIATDVSKNISEETEVIILWENGVEIKYKSFDEEWYYNMYWW